MLFLLHYLLKWAHCVGSHCGTNCSFNRSSLVNSSLFCAPGFDGDPCACMAVYYKGLFKCGRRRAYIIHGYWVGECENGTLCTGNCPYGFCSYNRSKNYRLPGSLSELDAYICGDTRTGVLCGECRPGYSVSYHSYTYTCTSNKNCKYGILFYIVSELLPLTLVFAIVTALNISFTSGAFNSFIMFAQIQDSLAVHGDGIIRSPSKTVNFVTINALIYRFFNFEYFSIEPLSFCLWRGAKVLDAMAFKYVTLVVGLALMLICVFILNSTRLKKLFSCLRLTTLKSSLIHGLTAFFVMCYSQCARVSSHILGSISLTTKNYRHVKTVVFRSGQLTPFDRLHLMYALPALFFTFTILIVPPLVLIMHPLLGRCLACCGLSESRFANYISRLVPVQFLDSFQSGFKDEVRFFAGLYFIYRLFPLVVFSLHHNLAYFYTAISIFFVVVLAVHAIVQPYTKRMYNVLDFLLFANLTAISVLSLVQFSLILQQASPNAVSHILQLQLLLIYLPLVCLILVTLVKLLKSVVKFFRKIFCSRQSDYLLLTDSSTLPSLREE